MTNLSRKAQYALRALYGLGADEAHGQELTVVATLAKREKIPRKFLETILLDLKNAGILRSRKGKGGGYGLLKAPHQITLGQVIRLMDGPLTPLPCVNDPRVRCEECTDHATCGTRRVMGRVRDAVAAILDTTTIAHVQAETARSRVANGAGTEHRAPLFTR